MYCISDAAAKSEPYNEMEAWIQTVQKYNGLPQQAIDSLVSVEYEAGPEQ